MADGLRKRKKNDNVYEASNTDSKVLEKRTSNHEGTLKGSYWLTRIIFIRCLGFIYFIAFVVALNQNKQLLGKHGLLPATLYLKRIKTHFSTKTDAFLSIPSLLLLINEDYIDWWLDFLSYVGILLSALVFFLGASNIIIAFTLWMIYQSIVNIGQRWYEFGWESQLLETGFLAIFFCPLLSLRQYQKNTPPSQVVLWAYRWLIFRIMIGAGLIKIRGDECWRLLTCMNYHYQTQPVPNPISYYLHQTPELFHKFETLSNHFVELVVPWFLLLTRNFRVFAGLLQILFQFVLILSGNLSFLNWLTILPSICCLDDHCLTFLFSSQKILHVQELQNSYSKKRKSWGMYLRRSVDSLLVLLIAILSIPVIQNLLSSTQSMNTSFNAFRIVNTYGAFGSITKVRTEVIIQGTRNTTITPDNQGGKWEEYEFHCKPGQLQKRPCFITPYHYRLDWLMWFSAFMNYQQNPWLVHLVAKLLKNDRNITSLIAFNPFEAGDPPKYIRAQHFEYEFTKVGSPIANTQWWTRKLIGEYLPIVDANTLKPFLRNQGVNDGRDKTSTYFGTASKSKQVKLPTRQ